MNYSGHMDWRCAMHLLFEDRLGSTIYSPRGCKKWNELGITQPPHNGVFFNKAFFKDDIKHIYVPRDDYHIKLLTVDQFMEMDFDIILVGNGKSEIPFFKLMRQYKKNSIFIRQIANLKEVPYMCKNIMLSTKTEMPKDISWITHYMEQPRCFKYVPYNGPKRIKSYSNYLGISKDRQSWDNAKKILTDFEFKMHGARGDDKWIVQDKLNESMQDTMFVWHTKAAGGGGFTCQEALALGKPVITKKQYAKSQKTRAYDYLEDGVNCIDLSSRSFDDAMKIVRRWSQPAMYKKKTKDVLKCFKKHFNFEKNAKDIERWIKTLKPGV